MISTHCQKSFSWTVLFVFLSAAILFFLCPLNFTPLSMHMSAGQPPCPTSHTSNSAASNPIATCFTSHISTLNSITQTTSTIAVLLFMGMIVFTFWFWPALIHALIYGPQRYWRYKSQHYRYFLVELQACIQDMLRLCLPTAKSVFVTVLR